MTAVAGTRGWRRLKPGSECAVFALFLAMSVLSTWPFATTLWDRAVLNDGIQITWDIYWVNHQVFRLENPWWTDAMYAPIGTYLGNHPLFVLPALLASPLYFAFGAWVAYGLSALIWPAVAAFGAYRLARSLDLDRPSAIVAGTLFGFSAGMMFRIAGGHLHFVAGAALIPFIVLAARRLFLAPSIRRGVWLGVIFGAAILTDQTMTLYALGALVVYGLFELHRVRRGAVALLRPLAVAVVVAALVGAPQIGMSLRTLQVDKSDTPVEAVAASAIGFNTDLAALALPNETGRIGGRAFREVAKSNPGLVRPFGTDGLASIGLATIVAAIFGLVLAWRRRAVRVLAIAGFMALAFSLGPMLRVLGRTYTPLSIEYGKQQISPIMPYSWLLPIPAIGELRIPQRFLLSAGLPLALLAGFGVAGLRRRGTKAVARAVAPALCVLGVAEGSMAPLNTVPATDERLEQLIRDEEPEPGLVLNVPLAWQSGIGTVGGPAFAPLYDLLHATRHGAPVSSGYIARFAPARLAELRVQPFYAGVLALQATVEPPNPAAAPSSAVAAANAAQLGVRWVVVRPPESPPLMQFLAAAGFSEVDRDSARVVLARSAPLGAP